MDAGWAPDKRPMNITLRQIRAFVATATLGRFVLAARHLNVTQSALSMLVRDLEIEMGVRLFDRHTRMVRLTGAGEEFLPVARKTLSDLEIAVGQSRASAALNRGRVSVASSTVLGATLLPWAISRFCARHPGITVVLRDVAEEEVRPLVRQRAVDLGVGTALDPDPELDEQALFEDQLTLLCPHDHPLTKRRAATWKALAAYPLIALHAGSPLRTMMDRTFTQAGMVVTPAYEVEFSSTAISMVAAGLGVAPLPVNAREVSPRVRVKAVALEQPVVPRRVAIFTRADTLPAAAAQAFIGFVQEFVVARRLPEAR